MFDDCFWIEADCDGTGFWVMAEGESPTLGYYNRKVMYTETLEEACECLDKKGISYTVEV